MEVYNPNEGEREPMLYVNLERDVVWLMYTFATYKTQGFNLGHRTFLGTFRECLFSISLPAMPLNNLTPE
jgi:hypothetical protein